MAIYKESIMDIDVINAGINRSFSCRMIGEGDSNGDRFGVRVFKNGEAVTLSGYACVGYFIRPDGVTLVIRGNINGNMAYVDLPEAAYTREGSFSLAIKLSSGEYAETMRIVDGTVQNVTTADIADPESQIPSLSDYEALVERAEAAVETLSEYSTQATVITGTRYRIAVAISS